MYFIPVSSAPGAPVAPLIGDVEAKHATRTSKAAGRSVDGEPTRACRVRSAPAASASG